MDVNSYPAVKDYHIRISPDAFVIALALSLTVAVIFAAFRTILRFKQNRRFYIDDYFLFYAVLVSAICAGVAYSIKDQVYQQIYVGLHWQPVEPDFYDIMLVFEQRIMVCSALVWSVIYAIKFSFLTFFRKLVYRIRKFEIYWWVVVVITAICGAVSVPLSFIVCSHFGSDYMTYCPIDSQLANERIFMHTTTALDILTDVLLISIPIMLLWNVQMSWQRKVALCTMLCLSAFCIVVAAIRTSLADLPVNGVIDTSWLVFWQGIEAAVGVIIVSCTAFRGLFGQQGAFTKRRAARKPKVNRIVDVEKAVHSDPVSETRLAPSTKAKPAVEHNEWYMSNRSSSSSDASDLAIILKDRSPSYPAKAHVVENEVAGEEIDHSDNTEIIISGERFEMTKMHAIVREEEVEREREGD